MDLVFRDGPAPALFWVGPMTRAELVAVDAPASFIGIRFRPGVAPALAGVDARDLVDRDLPAGDGRLLEALAGARSGDARRSLLLEQVSRCGARAAREPDALVVGVAAEILAAGGAIPISQVARRAGVSERTLHRRFLAAVGYGPKRLCRVARLGVVRRLATAGLGGVELALEAGYFDQAHLCHELASFGLSASSLAA
jgi:AraC-like DNA-binding protein